MFKNFKKFAFKGNLIDMAVGVVVGGAFGTIVTSLVNDIIMPIVGKFTAGMDFKALKIVLEAATEEKPEAAIMYGNFIQNLLSFLIIAFSMYLVVSAITKAKEKFEKKEESAPEEPKGPTETELLAEIRDLLKEKE